LTGTASPTESREGSREQPCLPGARGTGASPWMAAALLALLAIVSFRHGQDFLVFWRAARRLVTGSDLFPPSDGFLAWRYAPGTALVFLPLAVLPFPLAKACWYALLVAAGALLVRDLARATDPRPSLTAALALSAMSRPLLEEFACGQVNLIVLWLLWRAFQAEDDGRPLSAGLAVAVAAGLKLAPAVFLVDALLRRRWSLLAGAALGAGALAAAPLPFYGVAGTVRMHVAWVRSLAAASPAVATAGGNQSVFGLMSRLTAPAGWSILLAGIVLALALGRRAAWPRRCSLLFATAMVSPMGWIQNYVMALPAAFALARTAGKYWVASLGLLLLVPMYDISGPRFERWFFEHSWPLAAMAVLFATFTIAPRRQGAPRNGTRGCDAGPQR
jgi:Glycosyltransferase family 87